MCARARAYIYTHSKREREKERDRQRARETEKKRERERDRDRQRERVAVIPPKGGANFIVPIQLVVKREVLLDRHKFREVSAHKWDVSP